MMRVLKSIFLEFIYLFLNGIVCYIPLWILRKLIYQLLGMKIKYRSYIGFGTKVIFPWRIKIGTRTVINQFCHLDGRGGLVIGDDSSISIYCKIITASHKAHSDNFEYVKEAVRIDDRVWVGAAAIILNGSHLMRGSIVGAGSVIKTKTQSFGIYLGVPARLSGKREISDDFKHNPYINIT